jgi:hypothetical protein
MSMVTISDEDGNEFDVEVDFDVQPAEYEDGHCFFGGAIEINGCWRDGKPYDLTASEEEQVCEKLSDNIPKHYYRGDY